MIKTKPTQSPSIAGKKGFSLISDEKFRQLYVALLQCRMLDEHLQTSPEYDLWPGREAASAAVTACLRRIDIVIPTPRGILARYLHSGSTDFHPSKQESLTGDPNLAQHWSGPVAQLAAANEAALRHKIEKRGGIAVVFTRAAQPTAMHEIFTSAARQALPMLYVVEGGTPPAEVCNGIPTIRVDGSDIVAFYRVAYESAARAREGTGPTIIECAPWPDDPRPPDPLLKFEQYLAGKKLFRTHWKRSLEKKYATAIAEALNLAK